MFKLESEPNNESIEAKELSSSRIHLTSLTNSKLLSKRTIVDSKIPKSNLMLKLTTDNNRITPLKNNEFSSKKSQISNSKERLDGEGNSQDKLFYFHSISQKKSENISVNKPIESPLNKDFNSIYVLSQTNEAQNEDYLKNSNFINRTPKGLPNITNEVKKSNSQSVKTDDSSSNNHKISFTLESLTDNSHHEVDIIKVKKNPFTFGTRMLKPCKLVYDSISDEELDVNTDNFKPDYILTEDNSIVIFIKSMVLIFLLISLLISTWLVCFFPFLTYSWMPENQLNFYTTFSILSETVFAVDMALNFFTIYENEQNQSYSYSILLEKYLNGNFTIDLLASFPFHSIYLILFKYTTSLEDFQRYIYI